MQKNNYFLVFELLEVLPYHDPLIKHWDKTSLGSVDPDWENRVDCCLLGKKKKNVVGFRFLLYQGWQKSGFYEYCPAQWVLLGKPGFY